MTHARPMPTRDTTRSPAQRGFTLLEVLVAIAIFAFVGVMAMSGYTQLQKQTEYQQTRLERISESNFHDEWFSGGNESAAEPVDVRAPPATHA